MALLLTSLMFSTWLELSTVQRSALQAVDGNLAQRAHDLAPLWKAGELQRLGPSLLAPNTHPLNEMGQIFVEVVGPGGELKLRSADMGSDRLPLVCASDQIFCFSASPNGGRLRIYRLDLGSDYLLVGQSLAWVDNTLRDTISRTIRFDLGLVILSLMTCFWLIRRSVQPLTDLADASRHILDTGQLPEQLPAFSGSSEIEVLVETLNTLLHRVADVLATQKRLLADTSHELRNPLTVIGTDLDLLGQRLDDETRTEVAQEALGEVKRLSRLVEDLLLLSWAEAKPSLQLEPIRLDSLCQAGLNRVRTLAGDRRLNSIVEETWASGDPDRIQQILRNLLENAIRATQANGCINVWVGPHQTDPSLVQITVQDDGIGISAENQQHIFERFFRVDESRGTTRGGTGLGLALAKALSTAMSGDLKVQSAVGKGSSFVVTLPKAEP
jgi:two-component system, OmpR family, sensor kinase